MPVSVRINRKTLVTITILIVFTLLSVGGYFLYTLYLKPTFFDKEENGNENILNNQNVDKNKYPPVQDPSKAGVVPTIQDTVNKSDYWFGTTSLGNPTYTFTLFYHKDWILKGRDVRSVLFEDSKGSVDYGVKNYPKTDGEYKLSCEKLIKSIYKDSVLTNTKSKKVTINSLEWDRVETDLSVGGSKLVVIGHVVAQCTNKPESKFLHYLHVTPEYWNSKDSGLMKVMDDIKISQTPQAW